VGVLPIVPPVARADDGELFLVELRAQDERFNVAVREHAQPSVGPQATLQQRERAIASRAL
jgi:hypothetical protein